MVKSPGVGLRVSKEMLAMNLLNLLESMLITASFYSGEYLLPLKPLTFSPAFWRKRRQKVQDKGLGAPCVRGHTARVHILTDGPHTTHSRSLVYCGSFREFQLELERVERELERVEREMERVERELERVERERDGESWERDGESWEREMERVERERWRELRERDGESWERDGESWRELEFEGSWRRVTVSGWRSVNGGWMESKLRRNISDSRRRLRELAWSCFGSHTGYDLLGADKPPPHILAKWTGSSVETASVEVLTPAPHLGLASSTTKLNALVQLLYFN